MSGSYQMPAKSEQVVGRSVCPLCQQPHLIGRVREKFHCVKPLAARIVTSVPRCAGGGKQLASMAGDAVPENARRVTLSLTVGLCADRRCTLGLVGDHNVPLAQVETITEPYGLPDDLRRKSMAFVCGQPGIAARRD